MDLIGNENLKQALEDIQIYPEYKQVLSVLLKHEIYTLLQRLSETGEESIVMTASVSDGSMTVIGSNFGEKFVLEPGNSIDLVTGFKEQFARYCSASAASTKKRTRRHSYQQYQTVEEIVSPIQCQEKGNTDTDSNPKGRPRKSQKENIYHSPVYVPDESDKAIDETVSQLVKNILKQSEEMERESGETGCKGRRRRRRRTFAGTQYPIQKEKPYNRQNGQKQKENRIAQFFPTIPAFKDSEAKERSETSVNNHDTYPVDVKVKIEADDSYFPDDYQVSDKKQSNINRQDVTVENSVDKSIQKIIEMETKSKHSDSDSEGFKEEVIENNSVEKTNENAEEVVEETVEKATEESETNEVNSKVDNVTKQGVKEELDEEVTAKIEVVIDRDEVNSPCEDGSVKTKDNSFDQMDKSFDQINKSFEQMDKNFEESSPGDISDETGSAPSKRKRHGFIHKGYSYIRDKVGRGNTVYWKCGRTGCKGRVIQRDGEKIRTQYHNHNPLLEFENDNTSNRTAEAENLQLQTREQNVMSDIDPAADTISKKL